MKTNQTRNFWTIYLGKSFFNSIDWWKLVKRRNFEDEVNVRYTISNQERISQEIINFRRTHKKARNRASEFSELGISGVQQVLRLFPLTGAWNIASRTIFMCFFNTAFMTCTFTAVQCTFLMFFTYEMCVCTNEHLGWGRPSQSFRVTNFFAGIPQFLVHCFRPSPDSSRCSNGRSDCVHHHHHPPFAP